MSSRRTGLRWERTSDAIRTFVRTHGQPSPRRAVLCTFDFDPDRFNASLFPQLTSRGRQFRTLIIADAGALQAKLGRLASPAFDRYAIVPAKCHAGGVFHVKVLFLRAGESFLVGIGSANLTPGGFGGNLELMLFADHTSGEGRALAYGAASFLSRLVKCEAVAIPRASRRFIKAAIAGLETKSDVVLDTLDGALLPQMARAQRAVCGQRVNSLTILSPWHSATASPDQTDSEVVGMLRKQMSVAGDVRVFTQGAGGCGPRLGNKVEVLIPSRERNGPTTDGDSVSDDEDAHAFDHRPSTLHAKAYLACGNRGNVLFFGSANCTLPALARPVSQGGNVEVLVATRLSNAEVQAFNNDLEEMFSPAEATEDCQHPEQPPAATGSVLAGHLVSGGSGTVLRIEASEIGSRSVLIAAKRGAARPVTVALSDGNGTVEEARELDELFPGGTPNRSDGSWSRVLWENHNDEWVPFPVVLSLLEPTSSDPDAALLEILEEECGWWPRVDNGRDGAEVGDNASNENEQDSEDEDREIWTEAEHQGELDRIGVAVALLRKRTAGRFQSPKAAKQDTALLLERIEALPLKPHLAREVRRFLTRRPSSRRRAR